MYGLEQPKPKAKGGCISTILKMGAGAFGMIVLLIILANLQGKPAVTNRGQPSRTPDITVAASITDASVNTVVIVATETIIPTVTSIPLATNSPMPTKTPLPTSTPTPLPTLSPVEALRSAIIEVLGDSDRDVERITKLEVTPVAVLIEWSINGRYGAKLAKYDARADAVAILKTIHELQPPYEFIVLTGTFGITDKFGNTEETMVMRLNYEHETMDAINWQDENFVRNSLPYNIYDIADTGVVNPAFETLD